MSVSFEHVYENDLAHGERFIKPVTGHIAEVRGRYGKGWHFSEGAVATLGKSVGSLGL